MRIHRSSRAKTALTCSFTFNVSRLGRGCPLDDYKGLNLLPSPFNENQKKICSCWCEFHKSRSENTAHQLRPLISTRPLPDTATQGPSHHLSHRPGLGMSFQRLRKKLVYRQAHFFPQNLCLDTEPQGQQSSTVGCVENTTHPSPPFNMLAY